MAVNPAIALGVKGIELQDPLVQYGRVAAIQGAQQQNQLAQLQMQQAQREQEATNALNRAYAEAYNPQTGAVDVNRLRTSLASGGYGSRLPAVEKTLGEIETQRLTRQKLQGEIEGQPIARAKTESDIAATRLKQSRDFLPSVNSPETYANWRNYTLQNLPGLSGIIPEQYSPDTVRSLMLEADKALEQHFVSQNLGGTSRVVAMPKYGQGAARTIEGTEARMTMAPGEAERLNVSRQQLGLEAGRLDVSRQQLGLDTQRIKNEGQRIGLEGRRVAVLEENARRDADPTFQQRMESARTVGRKAAEGDVAAVQALPKAITRAEEGVRLIDELIGKRDSNGKLIGGSKPHPGFEGAVGATWLPGARFIPGTDAAGFMSRFDQIKGASFLEAFESLKGGGAITEKEGAKATDAINRMSTSTDEKEFVRAALDLQEVIRKGVENAQKRAARAGTGVAPAGAPAAPAGGGVKFLGFE